MNSTSNPVLGKTRKLVDLRLSTINIEDKLNSVFTPVTRAEGLTDHSNWLASMHRIMQATEGRVSEVQAYSDYIKKNAHISG